MPSSVVLSPEAISGLAYAITESSASLDDCMGASNFISDFASKVIGQLDLCTSFCKSLSVSRLIGSPKAPDEMTVFLFPI